MGNLRDEAQRAAAGPIFGKAGTGVILAHDDRRSDRTPAWRQRRRRERFAALV